MDSLDDILATIFKLRQLKQNNQLTFKDDAGEVLPMDKIIQNLKKLKAVDNKKITQLSQDQRYCYLQIKQIVKASFGFSYYQSLYDEITKIFPVKKYKLGTVGSYFTGCRLTNDQFKTECTIDCVDALPVPSQKVCDMGIIELVGGKDGYHINCLHLAGNDFYLYVESKFHGVNKEERDQLRTLIPRKVVVVDHAGNKLGEYDSVEHLPARTTDEVESATSENLWWVAILIIGLLIIFFAIFAAAWYRGRWYRRRVAVVQQDVVVTRVV